MPLSRLDNFLKNVKGNILYVDPSNLDATDGIKNQGNSFARPFKTLQRALIEASRFSYQVGLEMIDLRKLQSICFLVHITSITDQVGFQLGQVLIC